MSDPKLISPLLDGFAMGAPMSSHDGVQCCPAIKENSDNKYIVKIISVPASQVQMDALLLAGAYRDPADAMDYFKEVGEGVMKEAEFLQNLSKLEGFLSYDAWQMEPITKKRLGYEVYLVSSYKRTLEKYVRRNPVTHLEAMNLGLDMCSALSVCRQAGALYVDLKPTNIFMSEKKEYRIGDLGFVMMDALKYTELPNKYRSVYTPPELHDPMASLNLTVDTYAVGMILYQLYNDGQLPFKDKAPSSGLPSPVNADYELAEIIMKAINPDPTQRWQDPKDLGQALVGYMQRNVINDTPITVHTALEVDPESVVPVPSSENAEAPVQTAEADTLSSDTVSIPVTPAADPAAALLAEDPAPQEVSAPTAVAVAETPVQKVSDDTAPADGDADDLLPHEMSDELARMMAKADDILAYEAPAGVVVPEAPKKKDPFDFVAKSFDEIDDTEIPFDPVMEVEGERQKKTVSIPKPNTSGLKKGLTAAAVLAILGGLGYGGFWYYQNEYLQTIDSLTVTGDRSQLTATVETDIDHSLLTVICSDNYGHVTTGELVDGQAVFTGLRPNTFYKVSLEMEGFHSLVGQTSGSYTTESSTSIVNFTAVTGPEDGSVMLNFTAEGVEPKEWVVVYSAEGEEEKRQTTLNHSVTITGLTVSKVYTFTLEAGDGQILSGKTSLDFMASRLILAENLTITSGGGSDITVHWNAPGDIVVDNWSIRCYNATGYEEQRTVQETEVTFTEIDPTQSYTVEVTAAGMMQPARTSITANPIIVSAFHTKEEDDGSLTLSWEHSAEKTPYNGWVVMYTVDGSDSRSVSKSDSEPSVNISPRVPGATYQFTVQAADATSIFGNVYTYTCTEAENFSDNGLSAEEITSNLVKTPEQEDWTIDSLGKDAYTNQFAIGDPISLVLEGSVNFFLHDKNLNILFVMEDGHGNTLPTMISQKKMNWKDLWYEGDYHLGELDLPQVPKNAGNYKIVLYFNGRYVTSADFTITG